MAQLPTAPLDSSTSTFTSLLARLRRRGWEPVRSNAALDWRQRASWGMAIGLGMALVTLLLLQFHPVGGKLEYDTLDFCFKLNSPRASNRVAILAADEATLRSWNGRLFDDREIGRLLRLLKANRVRAAALAFPALTDARWPYRNRAQFARDLKASGIAHLPLSLQAHSSPRNPASIPKYLERHSWSYSNRDDSVTMRSIGALPGELAAASVGAGHIAFELDGEGRPRRYFPALSADAQMFPSLAVSTAAQARGEEVREVARAISPSLTKGTLLNFPDSAAGHSAFSTLSIARVLQQPHLLHAWAGRSVVIGPTASGATPFYISPHGRHISETELHAVELDNIVSRSVLRASPTAWSWLLTILACTIVGGFVAARPPLWSAAVALLALGTMSLLSVGLFAQNIWLNFAPTWLGIGLTYATGVIGRARREAREATHIGSTIEALTQVSEIITAQTKSDELLDLVLSWTVHVMRAEGASALLLDERGEKLHFAATTGPVAKELMPFTLELGEGIAGWVTQTGEAVVVNDAHRDKRFKKDIDEALGFTTRSILCLPLRVPDRIFGAIEVINRLDGSPFTEDDVELLAAVANQAAVVLDNARLYSILSRRVVQSESELATTNQRLEAEKNLLQTVLQSMTEGVVVTDTRGLIQLVNPTAAQLLPELDRDVTGQPLHEVLADLSLPSQSEATHSVESAHKVLWREGNSVQLLRGDVDSPRIIEAQSAPLRASDGTPAGIVTVFADVTEERHIEQAKSDFVSFVAHEMRSPLTSISGFSAMLQRQELQASEAMANGTQSTLSAPASPQRAKFLGVIHDESERLTRLINSLLDVARIEAGHPIELHREAFNFAEACASAIDSQRGYSSRHHIDCQLTQGLPMVHADRDKVTQILINLISNAIKYSPGGVVAISAEVIEPGTSEYLKVSVSDEGPGIAPEDQARLFQRFGRAATPIAVGVGVGPGEKSKPTGTGLGLFLTKHFVETHGGQIGIQSEPGQGATFWFTLPVAKNS